MLKPQLTPIRIAGSDSSLSKSQKTFNSQIKQIEKLRTRLAAWDAATVAYQEKYTREMRPLLEAATELQIRLVHNLDGARSQDLSRGEQRTLREVIAELAAGILLERDDAELKAIYNKHSRSDYDSEEAAELEAMKGLLEDMFDLDLDGDKPVESPEELLGRAHAQFDEKRALDETERRAAEERRARRKKSARQLEKEARAEADAVQVSQSIREIYRKLASALHPDRETDPQERIRKTTLMQRINQAYEKRNLLALLELQLELEHIDRNVIGGLDEERLRHYNATLKEQIAELRHELMRVEATFCAQFEIDPFARVRPETVLHDLADEIVELEQANREMERDLLALQTRNGIKAWLRKLRRRQQRDDFDESPF